ncbi:MAG: hypothetical protein MUC49_15040 [Raineya sp.]|jgi:hypothetical protein|nr:hypothetical protein [Raineya sp.]
MKILSFIFLMSLFAVQDNHPVFHKHQHIIQEAKEVSLYEVSEQPVAPKQHKKDAQYIGDYEVLKTLKVSSDDVQNLKSVVLDEKNYIKDKKTCPMLSKYAIKFTKDKHYIALIVSPNTCEKVSVFSSEKSVNKQFHDLASPNSIHQTLEKITGSSDR